MFIENYHHKTTHSHSFNSFRRERTIHWIEERGKIEYHSNIVFEGKDIELIQNESTNYFEDLFNHPEDFGEYSILFKGRERKAFAEVFIALLIDKFKQIIEKSSSLKRHLLKFQMIVFALHIEFEHHWEVLDWGDFYSTTLNQRNILIKENYYKKLEKKEQTERNLRGRLNKRNHW